MAKTDALQPATAHYDAAAEGYHRQYERARILDPSAPYPANYFRMQTMLNRFAQAGARRVIEVGVGEGTPLRTLAAAGVEAWGFDIAEKMVGVAKSRAGEAGIDPAHIFWGDIEDPATYMGCLKDGPFDGLMAMGVMPHVHNDAFVLDNMRTLVKPGGTVFIEFRNSLFSLFTFNRYTAEFVLGELLKDVSPELKKLVAADLERRLAMDQPRPRKSDVGASYDEIRAKFHNPFEVLDLFNQVGFEEAELHFYHYHAAQPYLEGADPALFRAESVKLEHETSGWRGLFLSSAFVVEAVA